MKIIKRYRNASGRWVECGNAAGKLIVNGRRAAIKCRSVKKSPKKSLRKAVRARRASRRASRRA